MEILKSNWKRILIVVLILAGLITSLILVQKSQLFKSKASSLGDRIQVIDDLSSEEITPQTDPNNPESGVPVYQFNNDSVRIKLNPPPTE